MLVPASWKTTTKKIPKKRISRGSDSKSVSPRTSATAKQRSVLGESKYWPGSGPQWKVGGFRDLNIYKALLQEPSRLRKREFLEDNSRAKKSGGWNTRRPVCAQIRNQ